MEAIDVGQVPIPVGDVRHDDQIHQNGEELICRDCILSGIHGARGEGGDGVAETVELLQGSGELVQLGQDGLCFGEEQPGGGVAGNACNIIPSPYLNWDLMPRDSGLLSERFRVILFNAASYRTTTTTTTTIIITIKPTTLAG